MRLLGVQQPGMALHLHSHIKQFMYKVMNFGAIILILSGDTRFTLGTADAIVRPEMLAQGYMHLLSYLPSPI